ncbi:hypothetical protein V8U11_06200 [Pseudomonas chlororaphis]|uniref:hypothetical protein n=1 Tax=Pseudomonas chlororaphis TaxID=587753 RepID=UPI0030D2DADE
MNSPQTKLDGHKRRPALQLVFTLLLGFLSAQALAGPVELTAKFKPDPTNPHMNQFINTTPISGVCTESLLCDELFSISIPLKLQATTTIFANHTDPRKGAFIKVPADWKDITVTSPSGDAKQLKFRISGFGGKYVLNKGAAEITGGGYHNELWEGGFWFRSVSGPCQPTGPQFISSHEQGFIWLAHTSTACTKKALFNLDDFSIELPSIVYELQTPDPLSMESGTYTGSINYTVGPGSDFDFGDVLVPDNSVLTLNFTLSMEHLFKVQFPPGADRLTLIPDGGWQQWLNRGRRPEKLFANQSFQAWASSPFKMHLECQYSVGNQCGIQNAAGHLVPVETRVTLPPGLTNESNQSINRQLLSNSTPSVFHPSYFIYNGRATLHFEVGRDSVKQMTEHAGTRYSGNVTVVWDTEI